MSELVLSDNFIVLEVAMTWTIVCWSIYPSFICNLYTEVLYVYQQVMVMLIGLILLMEYSENMIIFLQALQLLFVEKKNNFKE